MNLDFDGYPGTSLELEAVPGRPGWVAVRVIRDGGVRMSIAVPGSVPRLAERLRAGTPGEAVAIVNRLALEALKRQPPAAAA